MRFVTLAVAALGLTLSIGAAKAATISYSGSVPMADTNWNTTVSVPKFNPSLGTLTSATFTLGGTTTGSFLLLNFSGSQPVHVNSATVTTTLTLTDPNNNVIVVTTPMATLGNVDIPPNTTGMPITVPEPSGSDSDSATVTAPGQLALFIGGGNIVLPITAAAVTTSNSTGGFPVIGSATTAGASWEVVYTYTPLEVPEPLGLSLLGAGLLGLGVLRLRRKG
ncbi:choice-of-anchor E domain-containing protein [Siccirubricoccus soli]